MRMEHEQWVNETIRQGEEIAEIRARLNRKHEEIEELKEEENKKRERELQFLENMTKTSALLDKVAIQLDKTQRDVDELQKNFSIATEVMSKLETVQEQSITIRKDVDLLLHDRDNRKEGTEHLKWLIALFFTVFGGVVTYMITNFIF